MIGEIFMNDCLILTKEEVKTLIDNNLWDYQEEINTQTDLSIQFADEDNS